MCWYTVRCRLFCWQILQYQQRRSTWYIIWTHDASIYHWVLSKLYWVDNSQYTQLCVDFIHKNTAFLELSKSKLNPIVGIDEAVLQRKKELPSHFGESGNHHEPADVLSKYHPVYYEALDFAITTIQGRFRQQGMKVILNMEQPVIRQRRLMSIRVHRNLLQWWYWHGILKKWY